MFEWHQSAGQLWRDGKKIADGYSGAPEARNNPAFQRVRGVGPIPQGKWRIVSLTVEHTDHGPYVLHLEPAIGTDTFGRDGFLIHGDNIKTPGTASHGCIILPRATREFIWTSGDRDLQVIA